MVVYVAASGKSHKVSINAHIACEPEFYNNHLLDKEWSKTIERTWPEVRNALRDRENAPQLLEQLFWFVGAQYVRTRTFMNDVSRSLTNDAKGETDGVRMSNKLGEGGFIQAGEIPLVKNLAKKHAPPTCAQLELLEVSAAIYEHPDDAERAFMARQLVLCTLPHSDPAES